MFEYPALRVAAARWSAYAQRNYFWLVRSEYGLLLLAAVLTAALALIGSPIAGTAPAPAVRYLYIFYVFCFIVSLGVMLVRNLKKPEQDWYRARALAESLKTLSWRYCMRAEPFGDVDQLPVRRAEFRERLQLILRDNGGAGRSLDPQAGCGDQITASMETVRALPLDARKAFYLERRIREQRRWYTDKASQNKTASTRWFIAGIAIYLIILLLVLSGLTQFKENPATGILIVVASSVLGWVQLRKHNELVSSYTIAAHEIGLLQDRCREAMDEAGFALFVGEAEQAFSREHTQWQARSTAG